MMLHSVTSHVLILVVWHLWTISSITKSAQVEQKLLGQNVLVCWLWWSTYILVLKKEAFFLFCNFAHSLTDSDDAFLLFLYLFMHTFLNDLALTSPIFFIWILVTPFKNCGNSWIVKQMHSISFFMENINCDKTVPTANSYSKKCSQNIKIMFTAVPLMKCVNSPF